jgi:hypothetical protein
MNPHEITQELADKSEPFKITLSDGRSFKIQHPDYILISPSGEHAIFYPDKGGHIVIDTRQITSLEFKKR